MTNKESQRENEAFLDCFYPLIGNRLKIFYKLKDSEEVFFIITTPFVVENGDICLVPEDAIQGSYSFVKMEWMRSNDE